MSGPTFGATPVALPAESLNVHVTFIALDPDSVGDPITGSPTRRSVDVLVSKPIDPNKTPQLALDTALIVPFRFDDATSRAVAILVQIGPGTTDASHMAATIDCLKKVSAKLAATQPVLGTGEANARSTVTAAVQSLTPVAGR